MSGVTIPQIVITGKLARQIYDQIMTKDKAMQPYNVGTAKNPILEIEE